MKAFLVDDEPLARDRMRSLLEHVEGAPEIVEEFGSSRLAVEAINKQKPDVVFLDIQMPGLDGFDVVSLIREPRPYIIFVTAYDEFAIKAFEVHALDYLTKPVRIERLQETISRLKKLTELRKNQQKAFDSLIEEQSQKPLNMLTAKKGRSIHIIDINDVYSIETNDNLIFAHTSDEKYRVDLTLDAIESRSNDGSLIRVSRSAIVNIKHVKELIPWFSGTYELKLDNDSVVKVSRRKVKAIKAALGVR